jgi:transketolase C-terminal domain/subunit
MADVTIIKEVPINVLMSAIELALPLKTWGVSVGAGRSVVHLVQANPSDEQIALNVVAQAGTLTVARDTGYINANGQDVATITHETDQASMAYVVTRDKALYSSGMANAAGGVVALTLQTNLVGLYVVTLIHPGGIGTGSVEIVAV